MDIVREVDDDSLVFWLTGRPHQSICLQLYAPKREAEPVQHPLSLQHAVARGAGKRYGNQAHYYLPMASILLIET